MKLKSIAIRNFAPHPSTYLEGKRWSDEPQAPPKPPSSGTLRAIETLLAPVRGRSTSA